MLALTMQLSALQPTFSRPRLQPSRLERSDTTFILNHAVITTTIEIKRADNQKAVGGFASLTPLVHMTPT